jgi:predicted porin
MKKSLMALAVAGVFVAPAAMADVIISGAINVGVAAINSGSGTATPAAAGGGAAVGSVSTTSIANNYSNINIGSTDDIGNGNKVILNYQMQTNVGSLGDTPTNRNSYLGLTGGWGTFKMGTNENVYEQYMYQSDPLDGAMGTGGNIQMLGHSGLQGNGWFTVGNKAGDQFWRRTDNTLMYESPDLNGFTFGIDQTLTAYKTPGGAGLNPTITSLGGQYKPSGMPFFANLAYEQHKDVANSLSLAGGTSPKASAVQFGGGYTFQDLTVYARYETISYKAEGGSLFGFATNKLDVSHWWLAGKYNLPTGYIGAEIGFANKAKVDSGDVDQSKASMVSAGYYHNLSKQSLVYVVGTSIKNDNNVDYGIGAGVGSNNAFGQKITAFTVGMKHTF